MGTKCSQCNVAKKFQEINMLFLGYVIMDRRLVKSRLDIECLIEKKLILLRGKTMPFLFHASWNGLFIDISIS
jgi:hypothetical protein